MDKSTFEVVDPLMDTIAESPDLALDSPGLAKLRTLLTELKMQLGDGYLVSLGANVDVFDQREIFPFRGGRNGNHCNVVLLSLWPRH